MAEFAAADVPDEGKGPPGASAGGGGAQDSYPLTVVYCGGELFPRESAACCAVSYEPGAVGSSKPRALLYQLFVLWFCLPLARWKRN